MRGCSESGLLNTATKTFVREKRDGARVNAARLEYAHGTKLGRTHATSVRAAVKSARSGRRALKQQSCPGLRFSGGWTTSG